MRRPLALCAFLLVPLACGVEDLDAVGKLCTTDCPAGLVCVDGRCGTDPGDAGVVPVEPAGPPDAAVPPFDAGPTTTPPDAGLDASADAADAPAPGLGPPGSTVDAGPSGILCGSTYCAPATSVCCRVPLGQGDNATFTCMTESACLQASTNALPIRCDDAQDCNPDGGNAVCCVTADSTSGLATDVACAAKSNCQSQSSQNYLCDPHVPNACDNGDECLPSLTALPGYTLCRTP